LFAPFLLLLDCSGPPRGRVAPRPSKADSKEDHRRCSSTVDSPTLSKSFVAPCPRTVARWRPTALRLLRSLSASSLQVGGFSLHTPPSRPGLAWVRPSSGLRPATAGPTQPAHRVSSPCRSRHGFGRTGFVDSHKIRSRYRVAQGNPCGVNRLRTPARQTSVRARRLDVESTRGDVLKDPGRDQIPARVAMLQEAAYLA
jgi:hypothetical protein